jgi:hypothetical protein
VGRILGDVLGIALGSTLGVALGNALGATLGPDVGIPLGTELGTPEGTDVGEELGKALGTVVGVEVGESVGVALGKSLGAMLGTALGARDGAVLVLGAVLGAGLLLGTELGISVGQAIGVDDALWQMPRCVIAIGPGKNTSTFEICNTSITTFLYEPEPPGETTNVLVESLESVVCTHTSPTTFSKPTSKTSSTPVGELNSKDMTPPSSLAFHCSLPPVCWMINTLP